jgi:hypothetical protein
MQKHLALKPRCAANAAIAGWNRTAARSENRQARV